MTPRALVLAILALVLLPALAAGHAERKTYYPSRYVGAVPKPSSEGTARVVCKPESRKLVRQLFKGKAKKTARQRRQRLALIERCRYRHIQSAVDAARSGDRILLMPGVYREEPSRAIPVKDPKCEGPAYWESSGDNHQEDGRVPTFNHQVDCPNARNLVAIIGDTLLDADRTCDHKCNLQVRGMGRKPDDVIIEGDRRKPDVLRADRADGFQISNVTIEQGEYNALNLVETNGFRITDVVARWSQNYGVLTFTSDHGLYDRVEAYGNGDSGVYPGSGPEYHCDGYGIEVRRVNSHHNMLGASGTSGNGTWTRDSKFHHNAGGIAADSFAPGHPGMPQDCSKWTNNLFFSNNINYYKLNPPEVCDDRQTPFERRPKEVVCPQFQANVGVGLMFYGANDNLISGNRIYDQWRNGVRLFHVPAELRGEHDPTKQFDTSHGNRFIDNSFGTRPDGTRDRNGLDVFWSEQGVRNCWQDNHGLGEKGAITSDPERLPTCAAGGSQAPYGGHLKLAAEVPCASWHPQTNPDPPGCPWMTTPPDPGDGRARHARATQQPQQPGTAPYAVPLAWATPPGLYAPPELPRDRVLAGLVRNTGDSELRLDARRARLIDGDGRVLPSTAHFARGFTHGLYSPRAPFAEPEQLARRLGNLGVIAPGGTAPLTLSWRGGTPEEVRFGEVRLPVP